MGKGRFFSITRRTALCGILIALSTVILYLSAFLPTAQLAITALAGLFPVAAVIAAGRGAGYLCWAGSSVLALLLCPEKWAALVYLLFFGLYPVTKSRLEMPSGKIVEWLLKFIYFNVTLGLFLLLFGELFLAAIPSVFQNNPLLFLLLNGIFLVYDIGLSRLIALYSARIAGALGLN